MKTPNFKSSVFWENYRKNTKFEQNWALYEIGILMDCCTYDLLLLSDFDVCFGMEIKFDMIDMIDMIGWWQDKIGIYSKMNSGRPAGTSTYNSFKDPPKKCHLYKNW